MPEAWGRPGAPSGASAWRRPSEGCHRLGGEAEERRRGAAGSRQVRASPPLVGGQRLDGGGAEGGEEVAQGVVLFPPHTPSSGLKGGKKSHRVLKKNYTHHPRFETPPLADPPQLLPESLFIFRSCLMDGSPLAAPRLPACMYPAEKFPLFTKGSEAWLPKK